MLDTTAYVPADTPPEAQSPYADYSAAVEREFRRERRSWRAIVILSTALAASVLVSGYAAAIATHTNLQLTQLHQQQPVRFVERGPDGIDRVIAVRNTMDVNKGREMETLQWFVTWSRWISKDKAVNDAYRVAARAKLAGSDAVNIWDTLRSADLEENKNNVRDVTDVVVAEQNVPGMPEGARLYTAQWQEKTLSDGKVIREQTMMQNLTIVSGPPREGSWDGVNVTLLTEPVVSFKQRQANRR